MMILESEDLPITVLYNSTSDGESIIDEVMYVQYKLFYTILRYEGLGV